MYGKVRTKYRFRKIANWTSSVFVGKRKLSAGMWKTFHEMFNCLPFAALVDGKVFCVHAGLSPDLDSFDQLHKIVRPTEISDTGLLCDLLWSDPHKDVTGWGDLYGKRVS